MSNHDNKAIFITGASSGLGRTTAKLFASKDWKVIASMRDPKKEKELGNISGVTLMALDVTDPRAIERVAEQVVASGGVDVVFNNAGYGLAGALEALTDEQIVRLVNTNMLGAIRTTKAFIPHFREKRAGLFINTTSLGGLVAFPFNSVYHATKWAIERVSESMALELNQFGIGIKTIEPGGVRTDFFSRSLDTGQHPAYDALVNKSWERSPIPSRWKLTPLLNRSPRLSTKLPRTEKISYVTWLVQMPKRCMQCACSLGKSIPQGDGTAVFWQCTKSGLAFEVIRQAGFSTASPRLRWCTFEFQGTRLVPICQSKEG